MSTAKPKSPCSYGPADRTRRHLYALVAVNIGIAGLIAAFFWYHQLVQDRIFDRVVHYHSVVARTVQSSLAELHYISDGLWREALIQERPDAFSLPGHEAAAGHKTNADHISTLTRQRETIIALQQRFADPRFTDSTDSALRALDSVLLIGSPADPTHGNFSAQLELIENLDLHLRELLKLHMDVQGRISESGPHDAFNDPAYLLVMVVLLTGFGFVIGMGVIRSATAASTARETALNALRQNEMRLSRLADGLEAAQRIARIGNWEWDAESGAEWWSDENYRIIGFQPGTVEPASETFFNAIHAEDRDRVIRIIEDAEKTATRYSVDFRVVFPDGGERYIREIGEPLFDTDGRLTGQRGTIQDITEQHLAETGLAEAVRRLEAAQRIAKVANWEWDPNGRFLDWPAQMREVLGLPPSDEPMTNEDFIAMLHPEDRGPLLQRTHHALETGEPYSMEYRFMAPDGGTRTILELAESFRPDGSGKVRLRGTIQDVSELRQREVELRETAEYLKETQRIAKLGSWVWDIDNDREWWSDEIYRMLGLEPESENLSGYDYLEYVHPDDRERVRATLNKSLTEQVAYVAEYRAFRVDGHEIVMSEYAETEFDKAGRPVRMRGTTQNNTERKKAELALQEIKERLEEAQSLGQMGSWSWEPEEDIEWWSDEQFRIFGLEPRTESLSGFGFLKYVHPDDRDRVEKIEREAAENFTPFLIEYRIIRPDGIERTVTEQGEWIKNDVGGRSQWRGVVKDITERKRIEQELAQLNAELEQRVEDRTAELRAAQEELVKRERLATLGQLTATVSHELRNPLGAIRTSLYVVEKKTAQGDSHLSAAIGRMNRSITRCDNIIDELLDFTRMRNLEFEPLSLDQCLAGLLTDQSVPEGISVRRNFNLGNVKVSVDPDRLRRAVINIYDNACQAMEASGMAANSATRRNHRLSITTRVNKNRAEVIFDDTGPGITEDSLDRIFEPLFSTKNFGVGLGLPIVRQIMEQHGGGVEAGNRKNGGARFVLWLPLKTAHENSEIAHITADSNLH